jgi:hypothetical protein
LFTGVVAKHSVWDYRGSGLMVLALGCFSFVYGRGGEAFGLRLLGMAEIFCRMLRPYDGG